MNIWKNIKALLRKSWIWLPVALIPLFSSCCSDEAELKPATGSATSELNQLQTRGFLVACTPLELNFDNGVRYYQHLGYHICLGDSDKPFEYVPNRYGKTNIAATVVSLPAGKYRIKSETALGKPISIDIVIRPLVTTAIVLEQDQTLPIPLSGELYRIRLDGRNVGWVADSPANWVGDHSVKNFLTTGN